MTEVHCISSDVPGSRIFRFVAFLYGIAAYLAFLATILYAIGFVMGLVVPKTIDTGPGSSSAEEIIVNLLLMALFAVQHSVMARPRFKAWWTQFVPKAVERSTYVLLASLSLLLLFWQWRPMPAVVWEVADPDDLAATVITFAMVGWVLVFTSTFVINHFELFGLQQVSHHLVETETPSSFRDPLFYRFVRHPIYLGFIIAFWAAPVMTVGHLLFAGVTTVHILLGISLEERDLVALFGDDYLQYKQRVSMLIPWRKAT